MKRKILCLICIAAIFLSAAVPAAAYEAGQPCHIDLSKLISHEESRGYVEMMLDYYLRTDSAVQQTLQEGNCAVFFFEGCSDNMQDPELSDLTYYRVSAVCVVLRLDEAGAPYIVYFSKNCSTLPDRPLEYGAWYLDEVGEVGPATVCDGTYELYSVYHGRYEALHLRTAYENDRIDAVYMLPDSYTVSRANAINIHTRTGNHVIEGAMWSAGCILVGSGSFGEFTEFMRSTYYSTHSRFKPDLRVGTVTINRQRLKQQLYDIYENTDAVDVLLSSSRLILPETYLWQCGKLQSCAQPIAVTAQKALQLQTLPCINATDARSVPSAAVARGEELALVGSIRNSLGNLWYEVEYDGCRGYVYSGDVQELNWFARMIGEFFS